MRSRLPAILVVVLVVGTIVAGLVVGAQRDDRSGPVDLIVYNGLVFTGAGEKPAEAIAIAGTRSCVSGPTARSSGWPAVNQWSTRMAGPCCPGSTTRTCTS